VLKNATEVQQAFAVILVYQGWEGMDDLFMSLEVYCALSLR
jgi:hypothetical protein